MSCGRRVRNSWDKINPSFLPAFMASLNVRTNCACSLTIRSRVIRRCSAGLYAILLYEFSKIRGSELWTIVGYYPGAYLGGGGARGARAPPSASSPVLINSILGTTGSTAGLFNGCSTSVLSNPACINYLLTYYVLESRHGRDRDRHRQPSISARLHNLILTG